MKKILVKLAILGSGSWGTALANLFAKQNFKVLLWGRKNKIIPTIDKNHEDNQKFLDILDIKLHENIIFTTKIEEINESELIFLVVPSQAIREIVIKIKPILNDNAKIIICSKGIECKTLLLMSEVVQEIISRKEIFFLSGPNLAKEITKDLPCAANLASNNLNSAKKIAKIITTKSFNVVPIKDLHGAEIAAALKNVIAIFCGILEEMNIGLNAKACLITKSLQEIKDFAKLKNSNMKFLQQFCGIGDLILTCYANSSRNLNFGRSIVNKHYLSNELAEGFYTTKSAFELAEKYNLKAKITRALYNIVYNNPKINEIDTIVRNLF